ncbi:MAG TPA: hypothetical protein VNU44_17630 [Bryobacteraceae bacterium]|jgi:hypothetical protein|nr:hypothetical protein [Bryobacteraceae bacterium]
MRIVNPMNEAILEAANPALRLTTLRGKTIALLDISKPGGSVFLDRIEQRLRTEHGVTTVIREMKPTFAKPAPAEVLQKIRAADAVIEALAD